MSVRLGRMQGESVQIRISDRSLNGSVLAIGQSGSGKTESVWKIANNIMAEGGAVVVLNYNGSFSKKTGENVYKLSVLNEGFPIPLLTQNKRPDGTRENAEDMVESLVDIFSDIEKLSAKQKGALRNAILKVCDKRGDENVLKSIGKELLAVDEDASYAVYEKFHAVWCRIKSVSGIKLIEPGKITVLDFAGFDSRTQRLLAELSLASIWRYFRLWGQSARAPLYIICDEFQALSLKKDSALSQILREGRKFHIALLLATQTLETLDKGEKVVVLQAATRLFFRPTPGEVPSILKLMNEEKTEIMKKMLLNLQPGECLASGTFNIGGIEIERALKMTFRSF